MKIIALLLPFLFANSASASYPCSYKDSSGAAHSARVELFDEHNFIKLTFPGANPSRYFVRFGVDDGWFTYRQFSTIESTETPKLKIEKESVFKTPYGFEGESKHHYQWQLGKEKFAIECTKE